jgi:hypothetical protein
MGLPVLLIKHSLKKQPRSRVMSTAVQIAINPSEIIDAVKKMKKKDREAFLEDLIAATSPEHMESIKEARSEYKAGRIMRHEEVFGH